MDSCCPLYFPINKNYGKKALFFKSGDAASIRAKGEILCIFANKISIETLFINKEKC